MSTIYADITLDRDGNVYAHTGRRSIWGGRPESDTTVIVGHRTEVANIINTKIGNGVKIHYGLQDAAVIDVDVTLWGGQEYRAGDRITFTPAQPLCGTQAQYGSGFVANARGVTSEEITCTKCAKKDPEKMQQWAREVAEELAERFAKENR